MDSKPYICKMHDIMDFRTLIFTAAEAAVQAGKAIMEVYGSDCFEVEMKTDDSPLTLADRKSHSVIVDRLAATGIYIVSEEGKLSESVERLSHPLIWMTDPLDGTKEFIKRNGEFTVNIALIENGDPILGVVYLPVKRWLYVGARDYPSVKWVLNSHTMPDQLKGGQKLPLAVHREKVRVVASRSHMNDQTRVFIRQTEEKYGEVELVAAGSSLKLCLVAEGTADLYPRIAPTMEWDTAAGDAICRFADCSVVDLTKGIPLKYNKEDLLNPFFKVTGHDRKL